MKLHSIVDVITNSSSTVFIYPSKDLISELSEKLSVLINKKIDVCVNLSREKIDKIISNYGILNFNEGLSEDETKKIETLEGEELYQYVNQLFKEEKFVLEYDEDEDFYDWYIQEIPIDISLSIEGVNISLSEIIGTIKQEMYQKWWKGDKICG